jgi:hypothetical protein
MRAKLIKIWKQLRLKLPSKVISACVAGMLGFSSKSVYHRHVPIASRLTGTCPERRAEGNRKLEETSGKNFF